MTERPSWTDAGTAWVVDTGVFVACGRVGNEKYAGLRRFAVDKEMAFVVPQRVYAELGNAPSESTPADTPVERGLEAGWVRIVPELDYTDGRIASVMDTVQSFIAESSQRHPDEVEKADAALAGLSVQLLTQTPVSSVRVVTTDHDARAGTATAAEAHGFENRVTTVDGFEFVDRLS